MASIYYKNGSSFVNIGTALYPVGSVYISYSSISPASIYGGSWTAITGRFPYFNSGTSVGGSNTHTLTINEMPSHDHKNTSGTWLAYVASAKAGQSGSRFVGLSKGEYAFINASDFNASIITNKIIGGSQSHNNMPAYQTFYGWRRIS